ncbi:MAG: tetratricopeptide repeat protein [Limisphaerales bacterium]
MRRELYFCLLLAFATALAYGPVLDCGFTNFDDGPVIFDNPNVRGGLTLHGILWALTTSYFDFWHPLTWWSHMLDCELFGLEPAMHHLVNLGLHIANTLLLFLVWREMSGAVWRSAMVAALFALHPLHVESVAWLSERKDVLSAFFFLLTLWAYARYAQQMTTAEAAAAAPDSSPVTRHPSRFYLLALLFFALGLMSKPMLVTLPLVLLLLDYWPLGRVTSDAWRVTRSGTAAPQARKEVWSRDETFAPETLSRLLLEKWPFFGLALASCVVTYLGMQSGQHLASAQVPWGFRLANVPVSYARYLGKTIWPVDLAALYPMPARWTFWPVAGSVMLLLVISLYVAGRARRAPWLLTGWLMFLGMLVPVIGMVPNGFQSIADRYMYLPSIGLFAAAVWGMAESPVRRKLPGFLMAGAAALVLLACGCLTWIQTGYWRDGISLWSRCVAVTGDNAVARVNLGIALQTAGRNEEAMAQYREVLRLNPDDPGANHNLGAGLTMAGRLTEATNCFVRALQSRPDWSATHLDLGQVLYALGDFSGALRHYAEAVRLDTNIPVAFTAMAEDLSARGKSDEAVRYYLEAVRWHPDDAQAHYHLGLEQLQQGRMDAAIASLREAVRLEPDLADAHFQLAAALAGRRAVGDAIAQYREALRLNPDWPAALNNLAWILATGPEAQFRNGPQAVQLAEHACELTAYRQTVLVGTLAAAYAEAGQFDDAVATAQKACALASSRDESGLLEKNRKLLELYRVHQPYHEAAIKVVPAAPQL